jgi:hypothetical protein
MRFQSIALGKGTSDEMFLMVTEKLDAMAEARAIILRGGDPSIIIENYRKIIAANAARLSIVTERRTRAAMARWKGTYRFRSWEPCVHQLEFEPAAFATGQAFQSQSGRPRRMSRWRVRSLAIPRPPRRRSPAS